MSFFRNRHELDFFLNISSVFLSLLSALPFRMWFNGETACKQRYLFLEDSSIMRNYVNSVEIITDQFSAIIF